MCRISVLIPKTALTKDHIFPFLDVLEVNGNSNRDGIGISILNKDTPLFKSADDAVSILSERGIYEFLNQYNGTDPIMGHVRIATTGKGKGKKDQNSHPFVFDNLVGVHNGHFSNHDEIQKKYNIPDSVEVDSEVFFWRLNMLMDGKPLTLETLQACISEFTGSFALAIYDKIGDKLWVVPYQNDLKLYDLGYAFVVNTVDTIDNIIKYSLNRLWFASGQEYKFTKEPIPNKFAYTLDKTGLTKVGEITVRVETSKYTYKYTYTSTHTSTNNTAGTTGISTLAMLDVIKRKRQFFTKWGITPTALKDMLDCIVDLPSYYSLTNTSLDLLDEFFTWMKNAGLLNDITEKMKYWEGIYTSTQDEYEYARRFVPTFEAPFWVNTMEVIKSIPIPPEVL